MDTHTMLFGGSEGESRRRAISNISKIVTNLRNNTRHGHPTRAESAGIYEEVRHGGFMLPHERRRVARSNPYPPHYDDYLEHSVSRRHQWRKGRRLTKRSFTTRSAESSGPATVVTWQPDEVSGVTPFVHWATEEEILEPFSRGAPRRSIIVDESVASDSQQSTILESNTPRSSSSTQRRFIQPDRPIVIAPPPTPRPEDPASSMESHELAPSPLPSPQEDPASGMSNGGYTSSCDGESGERGERFMYVRRAEMNQLRREINALRRLEEHNYMLLNSSLQEHFLTTGALENRLDVMDNTRMHLPGKASTMLMWTVLDGLSAVILWLITVVIAKPYDAMRRNFRREDVEPTSVTRKSWRIDSWDGGNPDPNPNSRKSWRFDPTDELSKARRLPLAVEK